LVFCFQNLGISAPDYLAIAAHKVSRNVPVVHDTHEVLSLHHSGFFRGNNEESLLRYGLEEKAANEKSRARVYASHGIRRYIQGRYQVNTDNDLVFLNYVSGSYVPRSFKRKLSKSDGGMHVAYVGCITSLVRQSHYYLADIFRELARQKLHIHIHLASSLITRSSGAYEELAAKSEFIHHHRHINRRSLLRN